MSRSYPKFENGGADAGLPGSHNHDCDPRMRIRYVERGRCAGYGGSHVRRSALEDIHHSYTKTVGKAIDGTIIMTAWCVVSWKIRKNINKTMRMEKHRRDGFHLSSWWDNEISSGISIWSELHWRLGALPSERPCWRTNVASGCPRIAYDLYEAKSPVNSGSDHIQPWIKLSCVIKLVDGDTCLSIDGVAAKRILQSGVHRVR